MRWPAQIRLDVEILGKAVAGGWQADRPDELAPAVEHNARLGHAEHRFRVRRPGNGFVLQTKLLGKPVIVGV